MARTIARPSVATATKSLRLAVLSKWRTGSSWRHLLDRLVRRRSAIPQLCDQRQNRALEDQRRHRTDLLENDASLTVDDEGFRDPVDAPVDRHPAIEIGSGTGVRVAHRIEPERRVVRLVLVIETVYRNEPLLLHPHQQRVLFATAD